MTTNHPEKLDEALIRPGRVDHQVAFSNANQAQIRELFERMYTKDAPRVKGFKSISATTDLDATSQNPTSSAFSSIISHSSVDGDQSSTTSPTIEAQSSSSPFSKNQMTDLSAEELTVIARQFAEQVPNDLFSPAEIQGFLLKRKTEPRKALQDVEGWVKALIEQKKKGTKLASVQ